MAELVISVADVEPVRSLVEAAGSFVQAWSSLPPSRLEAIEAIDPQTAQSASALAVAVTELALSRPRAAGRPDD